MIETYYHKRSGLRGRIEVQAVRYDGTNADELTAWGVSLRYQGEYIVMGIDDEGFCCWVYPGDYVIRDCRGEFYRLPPDLFHTRWDLATP
jgi:hypothetical protein